MVPGEAGPMVFSNHHSSQQLSLYKGEPSFCSQAASSPPSCQCSFPRGKKIHAILEVLSCSSQRVFFHIRPEEKENVSIHNSLNCCLLAINRSQNRTKALHCRAATAPPMGAGAEDRVRPPCRDQQSCICMKEGIPH